MEYEGSTSMFIITERMLDGSEDIRIAFDHRVALKSATRASNAGTLIECQTVDVPTSRAEYDALVENRL